MALEVAVIENLRTFDHFAVIRILPSKCVEIMPLYAIFGGVKIEHLSVNCLLACALFSFWSIFSTTHAKSTKSRAFRLKTESIDFTICPCLSFLECHLSAFRNYCFHSSSFTRRFIVPKCKQKLFRENSFWPHRCGNFSNKANQIAFERVRRSDSWARISIS